MREFLVVLVAALVLSAGCLGGGNGKKEKDEQALPAPEFTATTGAIRGAVADDSIEPIEGALVTLTGPGGSTNETTTNDGGSFQFSNLDPAAYRVTVKAFDHLPQARPVTVQAGRVSEVTFLLSPLPSTEPWHDEPALLYKIFLECQTGVAFTQKPATPTDAATDAVADAIEPLPLFGADGLVDRLIRRSDDEWNESRPFGLGVSACSVFPEGTNNDNFLIEFNATEPGVEDIFVEMAWKSQSAYGRVLTVIVEPCLPPEELVEGNDEECYFNDGYEFARISGPSPLAERITTQDLENVTRAFNENETEPVEEGGDETARGHPVATPQNFTERAWFVVRIFSEADQLGPGAPADYALTIQQAADLYITRFFYADAPSDYSGIPDE